jgi:hypothetical protein
VVMAAGDGEHGDELGSKAGGGRGNDMATRVGGGENSGELERKDDRGKGNGVASRTGDRDSGSELKGEGDEGDGLGDGDDEIGRGGDDGVAVVKDGGEGSSKRDAEVMRRREAEGATEQRAADMGTGQQQAEATAWRCGWVMVGMAADWDVVREGATHWLVGAVGGGTASGLKPCTYSGLRSLLARSGKRRVHRLNNSR